VGGALFTADGECAHSKQTWIGWRRDGWPRQRGAMARRPGEDMMISRKAMPKIVPAHVERSTFVLAATAVLALLFWQWRPIPAVVWQVDAEAAWFVLWAVFAAGWALAVAMIFAIDHLDFFGLRQVGHYLRGLAQTPPAFRHPLPYRLVRHPMMAGFFPAFVATPTMTGGHLLFALLSRSSPR